MKQVSRFEEAVRKDEMKGSRYPDEREEIEGEFKQSKRELFKFIRSLKKRIKELEEDYYKE